MTSRKSRHTNVDENCCDALPDAASPSRRRVLKAGAGLVAGAAAASVSGASAVAQAPAAVLATALAMIDAGTTTIVDISQVSHSPEHSDAVIKALQESGIRAVYSYHRGAVPKSEFPQDIKRLHRTYFTSKDQLLTLALT